MYYSFMNHFMHVFILIYSFTRKLILESKLKLYSFSMISRKINFLSSILFFSVCNSIQSTNFLDLRSKGPM